MPAENTVRFICSENYNAPQLSNARGLLIQALDAALVTGIPLPAINSVAVDGSTIVITFTNSHLLKLFQVVRLTGFSDAVLNNDWRIIGAPSAQKIAINRPSELSSIGGIGAAALAPLGYEKTYSATNKAAYRNAQPLAAHRPFLRVDETLDPVYSDSYAKYAKVGILKTMSHIDDLTGQQIPFDSSAPNKNWTGTGSGSSAYNGWAKWYYARSSTAYNGSADTTSPGAGNRPWMIVGDERAFFIVLPMTASDGQKIIYGFGVYEEFEHITSPYFLASSLIYSTIGQSLDFSSSSAGAYSSPFLYSYQTAGIILFQDIGITNQTKALTDTTTYQSGAQNVYNNNFVVQQPNFISNANYLMGAIPHLRYLLRIANDAQFTALLKESSMFVMDRVMSAPNGGQVAFYLGEIG